jgi:translation initiation factor IF-2
MAERERPRPDTKPADKGEVKEKAKKPGDVVKGPAKKGSAEVKGKAKKSKEVKAARKRDRAAWKAWVKRFQGPPDRRAFAEMRTWGRGGPWGIVPPGGPPWARRGQWGPPAGMGWRDFAGPMMGRYGPRGREGWGPVAPRHRPPTPGFRGGFGRFAPGVFPGRQPPRRGVPGPGRGPAFGESRPWGRGPAMSNRPFRGPRIPDRQPPGPGFRGPGRGPAFGGFGPRGRGPGGPGMFPRFPGEFREPGFGSFGGPGPRPQFREGPPRIDSRLRPGRGPW